MIGFIIFVVIMWFFWWDLQQWMTCRESPIDKICKLLKIKNF